MSDENKTERGFSYMVKKRSRDDQFFTGGEKRSKEKRSKKNHHILETYKYRSISYRIRINHFIWASMPEEK